MNANFKFVSVDDDSFNNALTIMIIKDTLGEVDIKTYTKPEEALAFIKNIKSPTVLFLDINMPILTGWSFLEEYEKFSDEVKTNVSIFMLSSSIDNRDKERARQNKNVKGFLSKPLESETIILIANGNFEDNE